MNCARCGQPLAGGLDTYGDVGDEVCQACWIKRLPLYHFVRIGGSADRERMENLPTQAHFVPYEYDPRRGTWEWTELGH
jgi:hypothetical protein